MIAASLQRRSPLVCALALGADLWVGITVLALVIVLGIIVPLISPFPSDALSGPALQAPSLTHLFGTDHLGRDLFTRSFAAVRLDLGLAVIGVTVPCLVGTIVGSLAGSTRSAAIDGVIGVIIEAINAFPSIILIIALVAAVGHGLQGLLIAICATNWARYARLTRARASILRNTEFIQAMEVLGYSRSRILLQHLVPNTYSVAIAYAMSDIALLVLTVAGLSYLGLGVQPPTPEWGAIIADGRLYLQRQWWITVLPGLLLAASSMSAALIANGYAQHAKQ
jgi:peptide/nickel transport system permease protein